MKKVIFSISLWMCIILLVGVLFFSIFIYSEYDYGDFPYFSSKSFIEYLFYFLISVIILYFFLIIGKLFKWNIIIAMLVFLVLSAIYLYAVPLKPFSDMGIVWNIATNGLADNSGYLSQYNNQIPLVIYLWSISNIFGNSIIVPKIMNVLLCMITLVIIEKLWNEIHCSHEIIQTTKSKIIWFALPFIPAIIYENHIYNDTLFTTLSTLLIYIVIRMEKPDIHRKWLLTVLGGVVAALQYLMRPVGIIYIIATVLFMIFFQKRIKNTVVFLAVTVLLIAGITKINKSVFHVKEDNAFPVWSYLQMGINEEEFGFQDGTHSSNWTAEDCIEKYKSLGLQKILKIYAKKTLWMWSEGTYQSERYGFGSYDAEYEYENSITKHIRDVDHSGIRIGFEKTMKGQYYVYMLLALIGMIMLRKDQKISIYLMIICGFIFFYLLWEIKSRYIYSLYPIFILFAYAGYCRIKLFFKGARIKQRGKSCASGEY